MARTGRPKVDKIAVPCAGECGKAVLRYPSDMARHKTGRVFCSTECRNRVGSKPRRGEEHVCEQRGCGKTFYDRPSGKRRFCSPECRDRDGRVEYLTFTCEHCGVEFKVSPGQARYNGNRFCCRAHYKASRKAEAYGRRKVNQDGYAMVFLPGHPNAHATGWVLEHRVVMAEMIGRPLLPEETPHHLVGGFEGRFNNDPSNLELWVTSQPSGHRAEDLAEYARVMLGRYGTEEEQETYREQGWPDGVPTPIVAAAT